MREECPICGQKAKTKRTYEVGDDHVDSLREDYVQCSRQPDDEGVERIVWVHRQRQSVTRTRVVENNSSPDSLDSDDRLFSSERSISGDELGDLVGGADR